MAFKRKGKAPGWPRDNAPKARKNRRFLALRRQIAPPIYAGTGGFGRNLRRACGNPAGGNLAMTNGDRKSEAVGLKGAAERFLKSSAALGPGGPAKE